jgi:hypothetical protein
MKTQILNILKQYQIKDAELNKIFDIDNPSQEWKMQYNALKNDTQNSLLNLGLTQTTIDSLLLAANMIELTEYHIQLILSQH